jgi:thiamine-monophosphate kinase
MLVTEKALISRIRRQAGRTRGRVLTGIGDDCAVLQIPAGHETLVTTDFSLEGTHFRRDWHPAALVGHRCLARGLSDIAAMGGEPIAAFLSLALPRKLAKGWVDQFLRGLLDLAARAGVQLAGGDTAESPGGVMADIVVLGSAPRGKAILRSGARPGDRIFVSGRLGGGAAALQQMMDHPKRKLNPRDFPQHFFPEPRLRLGRVLRGKASAMIDLSDGLSTDLAHICEESNVGARIEEAALPLARIGKSKQEVDLRFALHGGEDYELLFTVPTHRRIPSRMAGVSVTQIGYVKRGAGAVLVDSDGVTSKLPVVGWEHFRS